MPKLTIEMDEQAWQQLRKRAEQLHREPSELARNVLAEWLQSMQVAPTMTRQLDEVHATVDRLIQELGMESSVADSITLSEQLLDRWQAFMDELMQRLGVEPSEIEADITSAYEEYRSRCSP
jgi:predicted transcriptional regulator